MCDDFDTENEAAWIASINEAFGTAPPRTAQWNDADMMRNVLGPFMGQNLNHALLPGNGGLDMVDIVHSAENNCLEFLSGSRAAHLFRPASLFFEHFPDSPRNSFFLLETQTLQACGVYQESNFEYEEVLEIGPEHYVDRSFYDLGNLGYDENNQEIPIPEDCRIICRYLQGKFLIVAKRSIWNHISATYDGRHNQMTAQNIREQIQSAIDGI